MKDADGKAPEYEKMRLMAWAECEKTLTASSLKN
jgi:hypothetical protein